jgi:phosphopentomutase
MFRRVIWIVLDSVGIGEMPDAASYGDAGSDTLGNIARLRPLDLPNMRRLGLANIKPLTGLAPVATPEAAFGRATPASVVSPRIPARDHARVRSEDRPPGDREQSRLGHRDH